MDNCLKYSYRLNEFLRSIKTILWFFTVELKHSVKCNFMGSGRCSYGQSVVFPWRKHRAFPITRVLSFPLCLGWVDPCFYEVDLGFGTT